jgi:hypothetical protein
MGQNYLPDRVSGKFVNLGAVAYDNKHSTIPLNRLPPTFLKDLQTGSHLSK